LHSYHEGILSTLEAVSDVRLEIIQQIAEGDRVATHLRTTARHTAAFLSLPPSGAEVRLASIRIDRLQGGKIAEHWAIADTANLMSSAFS